MFDYKGQLNGAENPVTLRVKIANSSAIKKGDALKLQTLASGGGAIRATAGSRIFGICVGIVDANGIDLDSTSPSNYDGTWDSANKTYTAAADNMSDKMIQALVVVDKESLWYNDTAGDLVAADEFKYFDLTDQDQVADQNGHDSAGALLLIRRDPVGDGDASKGVFKIAESGLDPYAQV